MGSVGVSHFQTLPSLHPKHHQILKDLRPKPKLNPVNPMIAVLLPGQVLNPEDEDDATTGWSVPHLQWVEAGFRVRVWFRV